MLGRAFERRLRQLSVPHRTAGIPTLDITDADSVGSQIGACNVVINCAAYTNVDLAESEEAAATRINGEGPGNLARRCKELGAKLVHFSTDYVFDGQGTEPYAAEMARAPLNAYGRSKAAGEVAIEDSGAEYLLVRTSWLYAPWANNFVRTIARLVKERETLQVVNDQHGRPSSAEQLVETTLGLLDKGAEGTFHGTDGGACSWFEFAQEIGRQLDAPCAIEPCNTEAFPRPARRPAYSVLDLSKTEALLGHQSPWQSALKSVLDRLE